MSDAPHLRPLGRPRVVDVRPARQVASVREAWRIDDEWWRQPVSREYRAVVLDDGRLLTLYHDLLDGRWYAQKAG